MAIKNETFSVFSRGNNQGNQSGGRSNQQDDRPKTTLWLNVGYTVVTQDKDGQDIETFISLPMGIALDTMNEVPANQKNEDYAAIQAAKNELLRQLVEAGKALDAGEARTIDLEVQIRHVAEERQAPKPTENQFVRKLTF